LPEGPSFGTEFRVAMHRRTALRTLTALGWAVLSISTAAASNTLTSERIVAAGRERTYHLYAPETRRHGGRAPVVVLLHGSGQTGVPMIRAWREVADREGLVLVAPDSLSRDAWHIRMDGPDFIRGVLAAVAAGHAIDPGRVYLFGHSGGAVYVLTLALVESEYFAAAALHAGAWRSQAEHAALAYARRRIPIAIFVGDIDPFFPLPDVRRTESALRQAGHPVEVTILKRHGHRYERAARQVNAEAWAFLKSVVLPEAPRYRPIAAGTASNAIVVRGIGP
jgi:poly(3-hydroxybutyrate) depolymerase